MKPKFGGHFKSLKQWSQKNNRGKEIIFIILRW